MHTRIVRDLKCVDCNNINLRVVKYEFLTNDIVKNGVLVCDNCKSFFPVYNFVPILISKTSLADYLDPDILYLFSSNTNRNDHELQVPDFFGKKKMSSISERWGYQWSLNRKEFKNNKNYAFSEEYF